MIDDYDSTRRLLAELGRHLPFEVGLLPELVRHLRSQSPPIDVPLRATVRDLHYAGDEGGIVCILEPRDGKNSLVVSLTQLMVPASHPAAAEAHRYQKRRLKRLRRRGAR
jgi:hypothetical protein